MPRIRKKTSNRQSTNDRRKIQRKVKESRKKVKKTVKSNPQWKSKSPKDPGIPNNFPFKDQILAEVSETRRLEAEEKARRKAEKRALCSGGDASMQEFAEEGVEMEDTELKGLQVGNDAIGGVGARRLVHAKILPRPSSQKESAEVDEEDVPLLINHELPNLQAVIDQADAIIEVIDARDPLSFRSSHLEELAAVKGKLLLLLNKIDLCPREAITAWATRLTGEYPTVPFRSSSAFLPPTEANQALKGKGKAKAPEDDAWGMEAVVEHLTTWSESTSTDKPLAVAVVGVTCAGKSSFINSLLKKTSLAVYTPESSVGAPTTTQLPQEITLSLSGKQIRLIDTPGFSWKAVEDSADRNHHRIRDVLLRSRGRIDRLKDPVPAAAEIVNRSNPEDLILFYKTPAFAQGDTSNFLVGVARSNHLVKKHGDPDIVSASRILLRDWCTGKFARYTTPGSDQISPSSVQLAPTTRAVVDRLAPRKELRKEVGLIRLQTGSVQCRTLDIESLWSPLEDELPSNDSDIDDEGTVSATDISEETMERDDDESPELQKKRKHSDVEARTRSKRVAFDVLPLKNGHPSRKSLMPKKGVAKLRGQKTVHIPIKAPALKVPMPPTPSKLGLDKEEAYDFGRFF